MAEDVPLVVPEVNGSHVAAIAGRSRSGYIVTNPNCSVTTSGTSSAIRNAELLLTTASPARARAGSTSRATSVSSAESTRSHPENVAGVHAPTCRLAAAGVSSSHRTA